MFLYVVTILWRIRLSCHILIRNKGKKEDFRHASWRKKWGKSVIPRSYLQIYLLQGALLLLIAMPIHFSAIKNIPFLIPLNYLGIIIWIIGFIIETISDSELSNFLKNRKSKNEVCSDGLWKYSRHPNYFGEMTLWWGIWLIGFQAETALITIIGPITITFIIIFISQPMIEEKQKKDPKYKKYLKNTHRFLPLKKS